MIYSEVPKNKEYIEISADKKVLTVHAKYFSAYAIGYSESSTDPGDNTDPGNNANPGSIGDASSHSSGGQNFSFTVSAGEGGSISPSGNFIIAKGASQTYTFTPKKGYVVSDVLIDGESVGAVPSYTFKKVEKAHTIRAVFAKAEGLPYYLDSTNKVFIGFASGDSGTMKYIAPKGKTVQFMQNPKHFTDVENHWAKTSIDFITQREIFVGTKAGAFSPDTGMTRAMFAAVIGRLYERSYGTIDGTGNPFSDVRESAYYNKYVSWANENGIILGIGKNQFAPDREITRQEMAAILYRFAEFLKVSENSPDQELSYPDAAQIGAWALSAVEYCQKNGIILGRSDGNFAPQDTATRAEVATILARFVETVVS